MRIKAGQILRYARPYAPVPQVRDDYLNYFAATHTPGLTLPLVERGISPLAEVSAPDGIRRPAILISSSPHKIGSEATPWQDVFDSDNGHIRYYGDNKEPGSNPELAPGNRILLGQFRLHSSLDSAQRIRSSPLVFFRRVRRGKRTKGLLKFEGFGIVRGVQLVTQYDRSRGQTFSNYVFECSILSIADEHEEFDWRWISARRDPDQSTEEADSLSPRSWRRWKSKGPLVLEKQRRRVSKLFTTPPNAQLPEKGSKQEATLGKIYKYYDGHKHRFEALAALATARLIENEIGAGCYRTGWITTPSSDGGADFVGRLDIGVGMAKAKLVLLGQAKCEQPHRSTGGTHIARTVARLKRGWIGAYVTTGMFSEAVQREVIEDQYPIILLGGGQLAEIVEQMQLSAGVATLEEFLDSVDEMYDDLVQQRRPDEILFD